MRVAAAGADLVRRDTIRDVSDSLLNTLVEEKLESVVFVMDYVQLDFGTARFTAYVWPTVTLGGVTEQFGDPGYRNALCAFITHEVLSVEESYGIGLAIRLGIGEIVISSATTDLRGLEMAMLQVHEGPFQDAAWMVWRPGEDTFAARGGS